MTEDELVQTVKRRFVDSPNFATWKTRDIEIHEAVPAALAELGQMAMMDPCYRALLQQDYSVTLFSGVGNLLTATGSITSGTDILLEGVQLGSVLDADGNLLVHIPHYADFLRPQSTQFGYYCITKTGRIHTRMIGQQIPTPLVIADIIGATGPLAITASYAPTAVTSVPDELEDDLVTILVDVVTRGPKAEATAAA